MQICAALVLLVCTSHLSSVIIMFSVKLYKYCVLVKTKGSLFKMQNIASNSDMGIKKIYHHFEVEDEKTPKTLVVCLYALWGP